MRRLTRVPAALALGVALAAAAASADGLAPRRGACEPNGPLRWALLDGFEDDPWPDPGLWRLPPDAAPMWWPSTCRSKTGQRSLWAFGGPTIRGEQSCSYAAPAGTSNELIMNLDLREARLASRLDLYFELWLNMPPGEDQGLFIHLLVPRAEGGYDRVPVFGATGTGSAWAYPARRLDLLALADTEHPDRVFDLRGGFWRLEWTALAPNGTPPGGGIFLDDVSLIWEPDPAVNTPTARPSPTATRPWPTATATATPSPTVTETRAPTATGTAVPAFLPVVRKLDLESTATSTPPPEPSATGTELPTIEPSDLGAQAQHR